MQKIKYQIRKLYASSVLGSLSLTGAWVAILAARGFSLVEIGLAETAYHVFSLLTEIPSGTLADVLGRRRMLLWSTLLRLASGVVMILSDGLGMVCLSIGLFAVCDSFASGSGEALAYDSLKAAGQENRYERYEANQLLIYRLCGGISTLCAGLALLIGHRAAYAAGIVTALMQLGVVMSLREMAPRGGGGRKLSGALMGCFRESLRFLRRERQALRLMFVNSLVGAADILLVFFLQAKLPAAGVPEQWLGPALFAMQLGGVVGGRIVLRLKGWRYRSVYLCAAAVVLAGILLEHTGVGVIMAAGGFLSAMADDALQVRTNTRLQRMFPSAQRATLISVDCFTFSVVMIVLSPLAGWFFSVW